MKNVNSKQRLFEMMSRVDKTFKLKLNEWGDENNPDYDNEPSNFDRTEPDFDNTTNDKSSKQTYVSDYFKNKKEATNENQNTEGFFPITTPLGSEDSKLFAKAINVGIDSHLEGFTKSQFSKKGDRLVLNFAKSELPILLRRLEEIGTEEALSWKEDIENYKDEPSDEDWDQMDEMENFDATGYQEKQNAEQTNDNLLDFTIPEWALSTLINGDSSGNSDEDDQKIDAFVNDTVAEYGNANFMLDDIEGKDNLGFCHSNDIDNLGSNCYRLYLRPSN